jgi:hypothetical protein
MVGWLGTGVTRTGVATLRLVGGRVTCACPPPRALTRLQDRVNRARKRTRPSFFDIKKILSTTNSKLTGGQDIKDIHKIQTNFIILFRAGLEIQIIFGSKEGKAAGLGRAAD